MRTDDVDECISVFNKGRKLTIEAMVRLYSVFVAKTWESKASTWTEFVEVDLQISGTSASKMIGVYEKFLLTETLKPAQLENTTIDRLYAAIPLLKDNSLKEVLVIAETLNPEDIRKTIKGEPEKHVHKWIEICAICKIKHSK